MKQIEEVSSSDLAVFRKKLKMLEKFRGKNTELITLYIPETADRSSVMNQLTEEMSQSSNIKSPSTRKNVQGALRKITTFLKKINFKIPKNGIVVFAGNVSPVEGRSDIRLFTVNPVKNLKVKLYWCDSQFHLDYLKEMLAPNDFYAIVAIDKNEATIAQLYGRKYEILGHFTSAVPGKTRAGGQCLVPSTNVMLENGEIIELEKIKEGHKIKSVELKTGMTINTKVTKKWLTHKETFTIETKAPKFKIECSPDHIFFIYKNGAILEKSANELKMQDALLFSEKISVNAIKVPLIAHNYNSYSLTVAAQKTIKEIRKGLNLSQKAFGENTECTQTEISLLENGKRNARKRTITNLCKALKMNEQEFTKKYCKKADHQDLPTELTPELAEFLGYFEGDGSFEKERIAIYDADPQIINHYSKSAEKIFNANAKTTCRKNKGHYQTRIYGKQIVSFINLNFPEINKACTSKIPKNILSADNGIVSAFLKGLYDAEGYVAGKRIGLGVNNQKIAEQIQLCLLRFGITSSLNTYDNRKTRYTKKTRYIVTISNKRSLETFEKFINFNSNKKRNKLMGTISGKSERNHMEQILAEGDQIKSILLETKNPPKIFYAANMFLNGKRKMSKEVFKKQILDKANESAKKELNRIYKYGLLPAEIRTIKKNKPQTMMDISVESKNFIANGLVVHNSAQRFERLREEAAQDFFKRISEKINTYFTNYGDKLKGVIIGGPGITKNYFINKGLIHHEISNKIIGVLDISYTDESGIREMVQKSEELLKDTDLMKEKIVMDKFLGEIARNGLATYGQKEVEEAVETGKAAVLLISEAVEWMVVKKLCGKCNTEEIEVIKTQKDYEKSKWLCSKCDSTGEIVEEVDYMDYMLEKAKSIGAEVIVVSTETAEGKQFYDGFGGLAAMLRYK